MGGEKVEKCRLLWVNTDLRKRTEQMAKNIYRRSMLTA